MEELYLVISLFTAGAALATGLNSLVIRLNIKGERLDIIYGVLMLALFIHIVIPPAGFILKRQPPPHVLLDIKRVFLWLYYGLLPLFLEAYSGYKNKVLRLSVFISVAFSYAIYLYTVDDMSPLWPKAVLIPLFLNLVYGVLACRFQRKTGNKAASQWLMIAMFVYGVLFFFSAADILFDEAMKKLIKDRHIFSLNLNPLAFILIMSSRLRANTYHKYTLEKMLRLQQGRWEQLLQNISLIIFEINKEGKITYVNSFATRQLGFSSDDLVGKTWIQDFVKKDQQDSITQVFRQVYEIGKIPEDVNTTLLTKYGEERSIRWKVVPITSESGETKGVLSIGMDTTDLDLAFRQVEKLKNELEKENLFLKDVISVDGESEIIGKSDALLYALQKSRQVANTGASVLLEGETGVGKELFANLIHKLSPRKDKPLVKVNCAALPDDLIESELFGHEKGAFTGALQARKGRFELADGGTIFLDEIGEMPLSLQPKLLRVLQSGEFERIGGQKTIKVDVRVISATNKDLFDDIAAGRFREDLYYRLNVYPITIPSLRNRKEDIPLLADHFIRKYSLEFNKNIGDISRADMNRLIDYAWPGNIRELINLIERSVINSDGHTLKIDWDLHHIRESESRSSLAIKDMEREHILKVLRDCEWKINGQNGAAEILGLNPNTLRSRMKKLNISRG